jgi:hypothetical protein
MFSPVIKCWGKVSSRLLIKHQAFVRTLARIAANVAQQVLSSEWGLLFLSAKDA